LFLRNGHKPSATPEREQMFAAQVYLLAIYG